MHELSIAVGLVDIVSEEAARKGSESVSRVYIRVGAFSGVVREALMFAFDTATEGTALEGAKLEIEDVPLVVFCPRCDAEKQLSDVFRFSCPDCGTATPEIRRGRELELTGFEVPDV